MTSRNKISLLLLLTPVLWQPAFGASEDRRESVIRQVGDDLFAAGGRVRVMQDSPGDAIAAGGEVDLSGKVAGDMVAAGGELVLRSAIEGDLYAAGGELELGGTVAGNARLAGGTVEVGPGADIAGGLSAVGGEVTINGRVGRYLQLAAGEARIDGRIGGEVEVTAGELEIGPNAVIEGAVTYRGPKPAVVADGAQVRGGVNNIQRKGMDRSTFGRSMRGGLGVAALLWSIGWMIAGGILITVWPGFTGAVTETARLRPGLSLLVGVLVLIGVPVTIVTLVVTVVGIPMALLLFALYLIWLPLGYVAAAAAAGEWVLRRFRASRPVVTRERIFTLAGALLVLLLLTQIPVAGKLIALLVLLAGTGSLTIVAIARRRGEES